MSPERVALLSVEALRLIRFAHVSSAPALAKYRQKLKAGDILSLFALPVPTISL
jgi:hypothetical protein